MQSELFLDRRERNIEECGYPYKFSVVVSVYNMEQYLEEALESVVNQTIGFEDNVQLILLNNATEDNAGEICERYQQLYPENVVYIKLKENVGPSGARNAGIPYVRGKYVNFLDSDDKWELAAFERVYNFFERHQEEIALVACRIKYFGLLKKFHELDYRFSCNQIVTILDKYSFIQLDLSSIILRNEVVTERIFDCGFGSAAETRYITDILLANQRYGVLRNVKLYCRAHAQSVVEIQNTRYKAEWYFNTSIQLFNYLFNESKKKYGYIVPYIQYLVMYQLQWHFKNDLCNALNDLDKTHYLENIFSLIKQIDDYIIWEQPNFWREYKLFAFSVKYGEDVYEKLDYRDGGLYFHNILIYPAQTKISIEVAVLKIKDNILYLEGRFLMLLKPNTYKLEIKNNEQIYETEMFYLDESVKRFSFGNLIREVIGFKAAIPLSTMEKNMISFQLVYREVPAKLGIHFSFICKLTQKAKNAFWCCEDFVLKPKKSRICIYPYTKKIHHDMERKLDKELLKKKNYKLLAWRWLIIFARRLFVKPIWLFLDRFSSADDNAEFLFKYIMAHKSNDIKAYFVVDKKSRDYVRLKAVGPVIAADSKKYRLMFALSDKIISSQSFYSVGNTFYGRTELLQDLFKFKFVYLQHGVIKDNHADTQSRHKKDLDLFCTSAQLETDSIIRGIGGNYCYDESVVKLTGLARYDKLCALPIENQNKKVLLAPTWRREGVGDWDEHKQTYTYSDNFKETLFFQFFNNLINDARVLETLSKYGYKLTVRLHPRTIQQVSDFEAGDLVELEPERRSYHEEIAETALLITDYSSIAFDYAYAYRPVIYTQFDVDTFYNNHSYKRGYFDYETMGFGSVCYDYESTVQAIIKAIENGCVMEEKYSQRVDNFFAYRDGKNCERIYNEILKLDKE